MTPNRGAAALLISLLLTSCAGFIPQPSESAGPVAAPAQDAQTPAPRPPIQHPTSPIQQPAPPAPDASPASAPSPAVPEWMDEPAASRSAPTTSQRPREPARSTSTAAVPDPSLPPLPDTDYDFRGSDHWAYQNLVAAGENARGLGYRFGPPVASLAIDAMSARRAFHAFLISCTQAINREDRSGLTIPRDWAPACQAAGSNRDGDPIAFFRSYFRAIEIGDGRAFATGYYEPEIEASLDRRPGYDWPIYAEPDDLIVRAMPRNRSSLLSHYRFVDGEERPYFTRAEIDGGAIAGRGLELAWARDPVSLFFYHVQGSGLLHLPDGTLARLSYAENNGFDYVSIGALMRQRALLGEGQTTSQGIQRWLRAHPVEGRAIMNENPRYIFFAPSEAPAPYGALAVYVTPRASVAADFNYVPRGAPVFLDIDSDIADGLWIAQDRGGAINGANRFDTFWGAGEAAHEIAGGMASRGRALILIPIAAADRLAREEN